MKITATSKFHGTLSTTFTGCKEGINIRRLRGPRSKYCLDYSHTNSHVCGCGYPALHDRDGTWGGEREQCGADGDMGVHASRFTRTPRRRNGNITRPMMPRCSRI